MNKDILFGETTSPNFLKIPKSKKLLQYIISDSCSYVELIEIRQKNNHDEETIIINLSIERPQKIMNDIKRKETVAIVFRSDDMFAPKVLMLREDFPLTSHQHWQPEEYPKSICLYEESYNSIKLTWIPSNFIKQIQNWLGKTATGKLHEEGQPLEPFFISSHYNLIIPAKLYLDKQPLINIFRHDEGLITTLFLQSGNSKQRPDFVAINIEIPETEHGIIRFFPNDLSKLASFFLEINFDLNVELINILKNIFLEKKSETVLNQKVLFIFSVPLKRHKSGDIEKIGYYAFLTSKTLKDIGIIYDIFGKVPDSSIKNTGIIIGQKPNTGNISEIDLYQVNIQYRLNSKYAAFCNNVSHFNDPVVAIGLGALGSQILNNFIRSGFGKWKIIDEDIFLPHNSARHLLPDCYSGYSKSSSCKEFLNQIIDETLIDEALCLDVLNINQNEKEKLLDILKDQKFIFDFSASIAVSRYLANNDNFPRTLSAYLTPDGKNLIIATEDEKRENRLDWLEMLHYREVINNPKLLDSLNTVTYHRYGNSCRDISVQLSQDDFAIWSGFASKRIRERVLKTDAILDIFYRCDYDIRQITVDVSGITKFKISFWEIIFDEFLINKMSEFRIKSLPNETGGVLVGNFDNEYERCYIIDFISSPSDSEELPLSFIRGCEELQSKVQNIEEKTLGQVKYIGEWHSHPNNCSVIPSIADINTFNWLKSIMDLDSLPSIMMIIGEKKTYSIIGAEPIH